ncbi:hypothetical protein E3J62_09490 [candidate division TA06 bacterium]|uniref:P/Homo B domain-containing protein n=1 Tax=candidate division TA06 bacterium TaxID=2250710 RepID=A0A523UQD8_UNCT6|nr:MAG: hypothetical protein E3J62_09490 [candidate division TA06 bacterium]
MAGRRQYTTGVAVLLLLTLVGWTGLFNVIAEPMNAGYDVKQERVYDVEIRVPSPEKAAELSSLGLECERPGVLSRRVPEQQLVTLREGGFDVAVIDQALHTSGKWRVPSGLPAPQHRSPCNEYFGYYWNPTDVHIPDDDDWVYSPIDIWEAPYEPEITKIDVSFSVYHTCWSDLIIELEDENVTNPYLYRLHNQEMGSGWLYGGETGITVFNGLDVNQEWGLWAIDLAPDDVGYIDEWSIYVYYDYPIFSKYPWPCNPNTEQHDITGTFGEFRKTGTTWRFHSGIDIQGNINHRVHPVSAGRVDLISGELMVVGEYEYIHVENLRPGIVVGEWVNCGEWIADYNASDNHVHLSDGKNGWYSNPLDLSWGIDYFSDNADPYVVSGSICLGTVLGILAKPPLQSRPNAYPQSVILL